MKTERDDWRFSYSGLVERWSHDSSRS